MDATLLLDLLSTWGAGLLFVLAILETCFVTGLAVPSGVATAVATVLAGRGVISYPEVATAAVAGGWIGDSAGYWIGRRWGRKRLPTEGTVGTRVDHALTAADRFLGRHPVYSVTLARLVPFVRTVMPLGAGWSGISWPRFLLYEAPGLLTWAAMYMLVGYLARESWQVATELVGVGWTLIFLLTGVVLWVVRRRRAAAGGEEE